MGASAIALTVAGALWIGREPLSRTLLDRALADRAVPARYRVVSIGVRWERIEDVLIGDPRNPDMTAKWIEVRLRAGLSGVGVSAIRAGGVRLRGRLQNGRVTLGAIDRLFPKSDGKAPFALPDVDLTLSDARMRLDTPYGIVDAQIAGQGNLSDGFGGQLAVTAAAFGTTDCAAHDMNARVAIRIRDGAPMLDGPIGFGGARCNGATIGKSTGTGSVRLDRNLGRWQGTTRLDIASAASGRARADAIAGAVAFDGTPQSTSFKGHIRADRGLYARNRMESVTARGSFTTGLQPHGQATITAERLLVDASAMRSLTDAAKDYGATPVGPALTKVSQAVAANNASGVSGATDIAFATGIVRIERASMASRAGARLTIEGGTGLIIRDGVFTGDTTLRLGGGGLPTISGNLTRRADGTTLGLMRVAAIDATGGRVALAPLRFAANDSGRMLIESTVVLSGPVGPGSVTELRFPLAVDRDRDGTITANRGCSPVSFRALSISGMQLRPAAFRACPVDGVGILRFDQGGLSGGARIADVRLNGEIGSSPLVLKAAEARVLLRTRNFALQNVSAQFGDAARRSVASFGMIDGKVIPNGAVGTMQRVEGQIGNVPLRLSDAAGNWAFTNGALDLRFGGTVADTAAAPRFNPLQSRDARLRLSDGTVGVTAALSPPSSDVVVTRVDITHDLRAGRGRATLAVADLAFGKALQPEHLTPLTIGVIANVVGRVDGTGLIDWSPRGVASSGQFRTEGLDFAAAFGPVTRLQGTINFNDLLGLATPPHQQVRIAAINTGIVVTDGVIDYQLLAEQRLRIERGVWPFSGGTLQLEPSVVDLGRARARRLAFRVTALDAAKFIERFEFKDLAATGIFDGTIPMVFDETGGRIENGELRVRRGGGTLAYVGDVSNVKMNVFANLAFDALKSIRYNNLAISLDSALDGEIISKVVFDGINENPLTPPKSFIARKFIGLPFVFNITIRAPFRSLLNTAKTFQDPTALIQQTLPELQKRPVQPAESGDKR